MESILDTGAENVGKAKVMHIKLITPKNILLIIVLALNLIPVSGGNVQLIERLEISPGESRKPEKVLKNPWTFAVIRDQIFLIPDFGASNIKVYQKEYRNKKSILRQDALIGGQKGYVKDGLIEPAICDYAENKFTVVDYGLRKIIIYERDGRVNFKRIKDIVCINKAHDIHLKVNKLYISGYITDPDGNSFDFYSIDLFDGTIKYLLPSYYKYGFKPSDDFGTVFKKMKIPVIGFMSWFDIHKDYSYIIWEGDLKVITLNNLSGKINSKTFGNQFLPYNKPRASEKLLESYETGNIKEVEIEKAKMSYVKDIFATSTCVLVIYEGPLDPVNGPNSRLQFYTLDGDFKKEEIIPGQPDRKMWFDKIENILYFLSRDKGKTGQYFISKYKIEFPAMKTKN